MAKKDFSNAPGMNAFFQTSVAEPTPKVRTEPKKKTPAKVKVEEADNKAQEIKAKKTTRSVKPKPKKIEKARNSSSGNNTFSVDLDGLRKKGIEYTGIRLRRELFLRLQTIAEKEKLKSTNSLITTILEAYCNGYEGVGE